jgi:hypothetical protein
MNVDHWNWAVWVLVIDAVISLCVGIGKHGKPRNDTYNAGWAVFTFALTLFLFWQAGVLR